MIRTIPSELCYLRYGAGLRLNASMTHAEIAAWVGAITGPGALFWDFYKWKVAGPKLKINPSPGMAMKPDHEKGSRYLIVDVYNTGTSATTITTIALIVYRSKFAKLRRRRDKSFVIPVPSVAQPLPFRLDVGGRWTAIINQDLELGSLIATGRLWCAIYHSWSKRPVYAPVKGSA